MSTDLLTDMQRERWALEAFNAQLRTTIDMVIWAALSNGVRLRSLRPSGGAELRCWVGACWEMWEAIRVSRRAGGLLASLIGALEEQALFEEVVTAWGMTERERALHAEKAGRAR